MKRARQNDGRKNQNVFCRCVNAFLFFLVRTFYFFILFIYFFFCGLMH